MTKTEKKALEFELQALNIEKDIKGLQKRAERLTALSDYYYEKARKEKKNIKKKDTVFCVGIVSRQISGNFPAWGRMVQTFSNHNKAEEYAGELWKDLCSQHDENLKHFPDSIMAEFVFVIENEKI